MNENLVVLKESLKQLEAVVPKLDQVLEITHQVGDQTTTVIQSIIY